MTIHHVIAVRITGVNRSRISYYMQSMMPSPSCLSSTSHSLKRDRDIRHFMECISAAGNADAACASKITFQPYKLSPAPT